MSDEDRAGGDSADRGPAAVTRTAPAPLDPEARVVAITGACHFLGTELIKRLEEDRRYARVLALDIRKPEIPLEKTEYHALDLTVPTVDAELAELLRAEGVDTLVHAAFLSYPTHAAEWAHELEDIGTMHVLNACAEVRPARLVMVSTTLVYGASPHNPNFLTEDHPLRGHADSRFITDKLRAEKQVQRFAAENPATQVAILRFAPLLGPTVTNFFTRFFSRPVSPVMMGYDPLLQFLHESDAVEALERAVTRDVEGVFNIVGKGVLPYTTVLALMGKVPLPMPHFLARSLSKALWVTQVFDSPPSFLDFLRYLCVADGSRARQALGFVPRYDIKRTILDFLGVGPDDADIARAQG
jgi:UDP-glucose 4-epimerase